MTAEPSHWLNMVPRQSQHNSLTATSTQSIYCSSFQEDHGRSGPWASALNRPVEVIMESVLVTSLDRPVQEICGYP